MLIYLGTSLYSCALHATREIDCVSPDVILRLLGSDDACHHCTMTDAKAKLETVEGLPVDVVQLLAESEGEIY